MVIVKQSSEFLYQQKVSVFEKIVQEEFTKFAKDDKLLYLKRKRDFSIEPILSWVWFDIFRKNNIFSKTCLMECYYPYPITLDYKALVSIDVYSQETMPLAEAVGKRYQEAYCSDTVNINTNFNVLATQ